MTTVPRGQPDRLDGLDAYRTLLDEKGLPRLLGHSRRRRRTLHERRRTLRARLAERVQLRHRRRVPGREPDPGEPSSGSSTSWGRTCAWSATTTRRSTSGGGATSEHPDLRESLPEASDQIPLEENFRSSRGHRRDRPRRSSSQNAARLPKEMKPTGAQHYEAGRHRRAHRSPTPTRRRGTSRRRCQALRGVAITRGRRRAGLSWSDMAILLRSVKANGAEPITRALRAAGIPFVVTGMNNLFGDAGGRGRAPALLLHGRTASMTQAA